MFILLKRLRKKALASMAKNMKQKGRSARNGNAPSPYQKYGKVPHRYSSAYYTWRANRLAGRATGPEIKTEPFNLRSMARAAE